MKRISRVLVMTLFSFLVLGASHAFANPQGSGSGDQGIIQTILNDLFGGGQKTGSGGTPKPTTGGGTAPIDGGISLLVAAGIGLGVKKMARKKQVQEA